MTNLEKYQVLVGKNISANGWHYDNGGTIHGEITEVKQWGRNEFFVYATKEYEWNMNEFTFTSTQLDELIEKGELPEANKLLNTGTNAKLY